MILEGTVGVLVICPSKSRFSCKQCLVRGLKCGEEILTSGESLVLNAKIERRE